MQHEAVVIVTTVKSAEAIKRLEADGWQLQRIKGYHHQFKRPGQPGLVTVPQPRAEILLGTLRSIYKQADWPWK